MSDPKTHAPRINVLVLVVVPIVVAALGSPFLWQWLQQFFDESGDTPQESLTVPALQEGTLQNLDLKVIYHGSGDGSIGTITIHAPASGPALKGFPNEGKAVKTGESFEFSAPSKTDVRLEIVDLSTESISMRFTWPDVD